MNIKHRADPAKIAITEAHILAMCKRQGITLRQLYHQVPSVANNSSNTKKALNDNS